MDGKGARRRDALNDVIDDILVHRSVDEEFE